MTSTPQLVGFDPVVGEILTDAFTDDPFMAWIFSNVDDIPAALSVWWGFLVANGPEGSEVWRAENAGAGAIWHAPHHPSDEAAGATEVEPEDADEAPHEPGPFEIMLNGLIGDRVSEVFSFFGQGREMHPEEPHWYLLALGTRSDRQGQGLGAQLVRPVLDRCDAEGLGAYLESSNPRNIPFYHRLGFTEVGEMWTPDDRALVTGMWRAPR